MSKENKSNKKLSFSKKDLVDAMAKDSDLSKEKIGNVLDSYFKIVKDTLSKGGEVAIAGFGKFSTSHRAARDGRNPQTGKPIKIAASTNAKFTAYQTFKDDLNPGKKK